MITNEMEQAIADIRVERIRQVDVEGWTSEHDDTHGNGELARAAACYAHFAAITEVGREASEMERKQRGVSPIVVLRRVWPWDWPWWKPSTRRRDLVKAAALIIAEIERLDRLAFAESSHD